VPFLTHLSLTNFKSIASAEIPFQSLNVLIGANGSGKSNLVTFFNFIRAIANGGLQDYLAHSGGAQACVHSCANRHEEKDVVAAMQFENEKGHYEYFIRLQPLQNLLLFTQEMVTYTPNEADAVAQRLELGAGHQESILATALPDHPLAQSVFSFLQQCQYYQFHDTSSTAAIKNGSMEEDKKTLSSNAGNLPSYLLFLKLNYSEHYCRMIETIRQVFPHFSDFELQPDEHRRVMLNWRDTTCSTVFSPHQFSDGTLRFIALTALLLQPEACLPKLILIDEPELGLHPFAIQLLSSMVENAASHAQVILATQSVDLVDAFEPEQIIVAERPDHETKFRRLNFEQYAEWLETYSLGELWKKNVFGGRPSR